MPMPIEFQMRVKNADTLMVNLRKVPISDWSRAWPRVIARLKRIADEQFATLGGRGPHGPWARLQDSTLEAKLRRFGEQQILVASGTLRDSLAEGTGDTIDERWPRQLRWGTRLPYALSHQLGFKTRLGTGKGGRAGGLAEVPARRPIDFIKGEDDIAIGRVLTTWAAVYFRRLGFAIAKREGFQVSPGEARIRGRAFAEQLLEQFVPTTGDTMFGAG